MRTSIRLSLISTVIGAALATVAAPATGTVQPYGGCDEAWQAPRSPGAADCRDLGWTVTGRLVLDPHHVVRASRLPDCGRVTQGACSWNFNGGHRGPSLWIDSTGRTQYVWPENPTSHMRGGAHTWRWVTTEQADALAEGGTRGADHRAWGLCVYAAQWTNVRCPDGLSIQYRVRAA